MEERNSLSHAWNAKRIYFRHFSMHKNTASYTKLRRFSCVDLCTQGLCGWLRGTWNLWRVWLENEHVLRVLWWRDILYTKPCCILVNIFLIYCWISIYVTFVIEIPIKFLKGSTWRGKIDRGRWKVIIIYWILINIIHLNVDFYVYI